MMGPKQASMNKSGWALGWLHQKLMSQVSVSVVKVLKAGAQTSYRLLKAGRDHFGALHNPKVEVQSLKLAY